MYLEAEKALGAYFGSSLSPPYSVLLWLKSGVTVEFELMIDFYSQPGAIALPTELSGHIFLLGSQSVPVPPLGLHRFLLSALYNISRDIKVLGRVILASPSHHLTV